MTADEAFELHGAMRRHGIPGSVTPPGPGDPEGGWLVFDGEGRDATEYVRSRVAVARLARPVRGFVIAR
ncbi:hypothetical protein ACFXA3_35300 [Streptomyces sp. NPDC059456]|uniref:hypothetical protein n=1 Tax=Streptomyces sp. NPDC059456 TaxID=3346838 RepID=UPI0036B74660